MQLFISLILVFSYFLSCQTPNVISNHAERIHPLNPKSVISSEIDFYQRVLPKYNSKKAVLVTNPSGIGNNIKKLKYHFKKNNVTIKHLIGLEHGFLGLEEDFNKLPLTIDSTMNLPIYHIYRLKKSEIKQTLKSIDFVVFDVQDMGMRAYTYLTVLKRIMDNLPKQIDLIVLDHPNLSLYLGAKGEPMQKNKLHFAGEFPSLFFTGLTMGESAIFYNQEYLNKKISLKVIKMKNFQRMMKWEKTGLAWHSPSPNLPTLQSARNYMSLVFLEGINVSVGRGTQAPFIYFGSPWFSHSNKLNQTLNENSNRQFYYNNVFFKPTFSVYKNQLCKGLRLTLVDQSYDPIRTAYNLILNLKQFHPKKFQWKKSGKNYWIDLLWGNSNFRKSIDKNQSYDLFHKSFEKIEQEMNQKIQKYFLY